MVQHHQGGETMLNSIVKAGFAITGTWPMRTERGNRMRGNGSNALASSIVLVCRKRPEDAPQTTRRNLIATLRHELRPALKKLQASNIAPVDLAQSCHWPRYGCVQPLSPRIGGGRYTNVCPQRIADYQ